MVPNTLAGTNLSTYGVEYVGSLQTYCGGVCSNSEKIYDVALTSIGVTSPTSPGCEVLAKDSEDDKSTVSSS